MGSIHKSDFVAAKAHTTLTTGEVIQMLREAKGWTQEELARRSGINPANLSALENNKVDIGRTRAIALAKAFDLHPCRSRCRRSRCRCSHSHSRTLGAAVHICGIRREEIYVSWLSTAQTDTLAINRLLKRGRK